MNKASRLNKKLALVLASLTLVVGTIPRFVWSLRPEHLFRADDWDWLGNSALLPLGAYVHLLPHQIYNDRAVGALLITTVFRLVGLDNVTFHGIWLAIHLLNCLLVMALGMRLFRSIPLAWVAAYAFGNWTASTGAVTWVAAVFDLVSCTFVLASILTFLSERAPVQMLSPIFYFLAMRTKESALLLPVLLLVHFLLSAPRDKFFRRLGWHFGLLGLFVAMHGYFYFFQYTRTTGPGDPYFLRFDLLTLAKGLSFYLRAMLYRVYPLPAALLAVGGALLLAGMIGRKGEAVVIGAAGFLLLLAPVLFLVNRRDALYLYAPSAFFAILWVGLARRAMDLVGWAVVRRSAAH